MKTINHIRQSQVNVLKRPTKFDPFVREHLASGRHLELTLPRTQITLYFPDHEKYGYALRAQKQLTLAGILINCNLGSPWAPKFSLL